MSGTRSASANKGPSANNGAGDAADANGKKPRKKKLLMLIVVLALVGAGGGGYVMFHGQGASTASGAPKPEPSPVPGITLTLDPITVNLAGGRYLRLGLAVQFTAKATTKAGTEPDGARALDQAILYLSDQHAEDLQTPEQIDAAKRELTQRLDAAYDGNVLEVLLTQFVIQ